MVLLDRVNKEIQAVDLQIARVQDLAREQLKELNKRRIALIAVLQVITPELEAAVAALESVGIDLGPKR